MSWKIEEVRELRGYTVEWAEPGRYYLSRGNLLFLSSSLTPPFEQVASVDAPAWRRIASSSRLAQRLLRFLITNTVPLQNGKIFVTFDKSVGVVEGGRYRELPGLVRPCRVLRFGCAVDDRGDVYFGEYLANPDRGAVRVYRYTKESGSLEIARVFEPGSVRHIHGIYADPHTASLVCLTGDNDLECRVLRTRDGFRTIDVIGEGDESWRAVSMLFDRQHIYYGTDAEHRANRIYRVNRETGARESMGEVDGTVFFSKIIGDDLFFATTAEGAPSQIDNVAAIWHLAPNGALSEIARFPKDRWHRSLFMFGTIHFPYANLLDDRLFFSLVGVAGDNNTYRMMRA